MDKPLIALKKLSEILDDWSAMDTRHVNGACAASSAIVADSVEEPTTTSSIPCAGTSIPYSERTMLTTIRQTNAYDGHLMLSTRSTRSSPTVNRTAIMKQILLTLLLLPFVAFADPDPSAEFQALVAKFPKTAQPQSPGQSITLAVTNSDARKTDSLVTPILGTIDYTMTVAAQNSKVDLRLRVELTWKKNTWKLHRILRTDMNPPVDVTAERMGKKQLETLKDFYGPLQ